MRKLNIKKSAEKIDINMPSIVNQLLDRLPFIAKTIISDVKDNKYFLTNPDDVNEHAPEWHQFGIITHTRKFVDTMLNKAPEQLEQWNNWDPLFILGLWKIDGVSKLDLLLVTAVFHDIGKFARDFKLKDGKTAPDYSRHEEYSEKLILSDKIRPILLQYYPFTENQLQYIARCAGLHYVLGRQVRKPVESCNGYNFKYIESQQCQDILQNIIQQYFDYRIEIGFLFLCDLLSHHNFDIEANSDDDIELAIEKKKYRLNPDSNQLIKAIHHRPVNRKLAEIYLNMVVKWTKNH